MPFVFTQDLGWLCTVIHPRQPDHQTTAKDFDMQLIIIILFCIISNYIKRSKYFYSLTTATVLIFTQDCLMRK